MSNYNSLSPREIFSLSQSHAIKPVRNQNRSIHTANICEDKCSKQLEEDNRKISLLLRTQSASANEFYKNEEKAFQSERKIEEINLGVISVNNPISLESFIGLNCYGSIVISEKKEPIIISINIHIGSIKLYTSLKVKKPNEKMCDERIKVNKSQEIIIYKGNITFSKSLYMRIETNNSVKLTIEVKFELKKKIINPFKEVKEKECALKINNFIKAFKSNRSLAYDIFRKADIIRKKRKAKVLLLSKHLDHISKNIRVSTVYQEYCTANTLKRISYNQSIKRVADTKKSLLTKTIADSIVKINKWNIIKEIVHR
jgi:hypothetical protein